MTIWNNNENTMNSVKTNVINGKMIMKKNNENDVVKVMKDKWKYSIMKWLIIIRKYMKWRGRKEITNIFCGQN